MKIANARPVDREGGVRADAQVAHEIERAGQPRAERGHDVHGQLHLPDRDALALGSRLAVADRQQRQAPACCAGRGTPAATDATTQASAIQKVVLSRVALSMPRSAVRLVPEPPPTRLMLANDSLKTSEMTQVPMAK